MKNPYEALLSPSSPFVKETSEKYTPFSERHMQAIWLEQKGLPAVFELQGKPLKILSSGIWNVEAGPDFKQAHFLWGDESLRGDVELHLHAESWKYHKHPLDTNYNGVVLHVVFFPTQKIPKVVTESGKVLPQLFLEPFLTMPLEKILSEIDLELYPYRRCSGTGKCSRSVFSKLTVSQTQDFFMWAALWRLQKKAERLHSFFSSPYRFWGGVAQVLGYKKNSHVFCELFADLIARGEGKTEEQLVSWCLGRCGFFTPPFLEKWKESVYYQLLHSLWGSSEGLLSLHLGSIRPLQHPIRRIVLLVKCRSLFPFSPIENFIHMWKQGEEERWSEVFLRLFYKKLHVFLPDLSDLYWERCYLFEKEKKSQRVPLAGKGLVKEIIVNVILPLIWYEIDRQGVKEFERRAFVQLYQLFASTNTGKFRYLRYRLHGETPSFSTLYRKSSVEQGMYQLHYDFCTHYEASCDGCPFIERYTLEVKKIISN